MTFQKVTRIKASAFGYAISFLLLIGLICSGVLFISSVNKRLEVNFLLEEHMLFNNYLGLKIGASFPYGTKSIFNTSGDTTTIHVKKWGAFKVVVSKTRHKNKELVKAALAGALSSDIPLTLYIPNRKNVIRLCGNTKIEGLVFVSEQGFERGSISGKPYNGDKLLYGDQKMSDKKLPELTLKYETFEHSWNTYEYTKIDLPINDTVFSFTEKTSVVSMVEPISIENSLSGNCIIHSFDSIIVKSTASLDNIILIAPKVYFEENFEGNVQVTASEKVVCNKKVFLKYPSTISLVETDVENERTHGVELKEGSKVVGGIQVLSKNPDFRHPVYLLIDKAIVGGIVYNQGETELKGKIIGSLYTNWLSLNYGGSKYRNYLLDAMISRNKLPDYFVTPNWLQNEGKSKSIIMKCF